MKDWDKQDIKAFKDLKMDCNKCFGLCCVALYYAASEGFPKDKESGVPCHYLSEDFKCQIHNKLQEKGLHGCMAYECMGAGQKVSQITYKGESWRQNPEIAKEMFDTFIVMRHLQELLWYLTEASLKTQDNVLKKSMDIQIQQIEELTRLTPAQILKLDLTNYRNKVNPLLIKVSQEISKRAQQVIKGSGKKFVRRIEWIGADLRKMNLVGSNLSGTLLIAANLSGVDLTGATLIGADLRDANLCGAKLNHTLFLTQFQIDTAKGNSKTLLPAHLKRPTHWDE